MSTGSRPDAPQETPPEGAGPARLDNTLEHVRQALRGLQFGEVSIIVQDGVVVQVDRIERKRFRRRER